MLKPLSPAAQDALRRRPHQAVLAWLSVASMVAFAVFLAADLHGWALFSAFLAALVSSGYLENRCNLDLRFGNILWRCLGFSTFVSILMVFVAIVNADAAATEPDGKLVLVVVVWVSSLVATWVVLLNEGDGQHPKGRRFAYAHLVCIVGVCVYMASWS